MNEPSIFSWITQHWDDLLAIAGGIIFVASLIVKFTPSQTDDLWVARIRSFLEKVALNAHPTQTPGAKPPVPPPSLYRDWPTDRRPPGALGLLLFGLLAASVLSACAPVAGPTPLLSPEAGAQVAAVCREAADTIRDAADRRREGTLPDTVAPVVDRLVAVSRRPCSDQDQALPSDVDRVETAIQAVQEAMANG